MRFRKTDAVLLATAVALSSLVWSGSRLVPIVYRALYRTESEATIRSSLMHPLARIASDCSLFIVALICATGFIAAFLSRTRQSQAFVLLGVVLQCLVAWVACLCFCFDSFTDGMCLHHGPQFDIGMFVISAWGVFPVTLAALSILFGVAIQSIRKKE